mmetsp:Transcript_6027/g.16397  ORF Transcript_6027/g.16397 Transcript_6027/m.16397 type:complete len:88 (-) Transcript_6027:39-302(-)
MPRHKGSLPWIRSGKCTSRVARTPFDKCDDEYCTLSAMYSGMHRASYEHSYEEEQWHQRYSMDTCDYCNPCTETQASALSGKYYNII